MSEEGIGLIIGQDPCMKIKYSDIKERGIMENLQIRVLQLAMIFLMVRCSCF